MYNADSECIVGKYDRVAKKWIGGTRVHATASAATPSAASAANSRRRGLGYDPEVRDEECVEVEEFRIDGQDFLIDGDGLLYDPHTENDVGEYDRSAKKWISRLPELDDAETGNCLCVQPHASGSWEIPRSSSITCVTLYDF